MNIVNKVLTWLDGRKSTILSISAAILSYCVAGGFISPELGALLQSILSILAGGAIIATNKLGIKRK